MSHPGAGGKQPERSSKPYDSYLLRYQDMKHLQESKNQPKNTFKDITDDVSVVLQRRNSQRQEQDSSTTYEMPQIKEELSDDKSSKKKGCKTKLCALL